MTNSPTPSRAAGPQPSATVRRMKEYHPPLGDRSGLRLDFNENTFACSPNVREALGRISRSDLTRYPEREPVEDRVRRLAGARVYLFSLGRPMPSGMKLFLWRCVSMVEDFHAI